MSQGICSGRYTGLAETKGHRILYQLLNRKTRNLRRYRAHVCHRGGAPSPEPYTSTRIPPGEKVKGEFWPTLHRFTAPPSVTCSVQPRTQNRARRHQERAVSDMQPCAAHAQGCREVQTRRKKKRTVTGMYSLVHKIRLPGDRGGTVSGTEPCTVDRGGSCRCRLVGARRGDFPSSSASEYAPSSRTLS